MPGMSNFSDKAETGSDSTRQVLLREAIRLFGQKGFDGASTREIADAAGTNVASIAYHFGGKAGLHRACGEFIAAMMANASGQAGEAAGTPPDSREELLQMISAILQRMSVFLFSGTQSELVVPFVLREMTQPGEAFEAIYSGMMEPVHKRLCLLWSAVAGGDPNSDEVKLTIFSMIGQLLYFRIGAHAVARRLGRERLAEQDVGLICSVIESNISARLGATARGLP